MIRAIAAGALAAGFALAAPALASPIDGLWRSPSQNALVQIYGCDAAVCGKLIDSDRIEANPIVADDKNHTAALRARPLKGLVFIDGFTGGPTEWKGGSVYNPDDGGTYHGSMRLVDADTLKLTGCIIVPLCKSEVWKRVK
jgi:uncharacterized protein (DUF2147 family)